jgi:hypothetical protein
LAEAVALADRWAESDYPYYLVESLSQELKAMVVNPPFDIQVDDERVRSFLMIASLHYGSSWAFWAERNADSLQSVQQVIKVIGLSYLRPRLRAICTLQFFPAALVERAAAGMGGALDPRIRRLLQKVVAQHKAREYLQQLIAGEDAEAGKKAASVLNELARCEDEADPDLESL